MRECIVPLEILYLQQEDVIKAGVLDIDAALGDVEEVFRLMAEGEVVNPPKKALDLYYPDGSPKGHLVAMPAYIKPLAIAGIKWAAGFFRNPQLHGLPHGIDVVILSSPDTGQPLAIMDGTLITAARTGAVAGVGAKYLSPPSPEKLALIGAGVIGRTSLWAVCTAVKELKEVYIFDLDRGKAEALTRESPIDARVAESLEEAVSKADIIVTATTSHGRFIKAEWLGEDCLCIEMGKNELEDRILLKSDRIFVDYWEQLKDRPWISIVELWRKGLLEESRIESIIGLVASGKRVSEGLRVFSPIGMACEDIIVAKRIYDSALRMGLGSKLKLWDKPLWI